MFGCGGPADGGPDCDPIWGWGGLLGAGFGTPESPPGGAVAIGETGGCCGICVGGWTCCGGGGLAGGAFIKLGSETEPDSDVAAFATALDVKSLNNSSFSVFRAKHKSVHLP